MKIKKSLSIILTAAIIAAILCCPMSAIAKEDYSYKLDKALAEKLEKMNDDDVVTASLWLDDIDTVPIKNAVKSELADIVPTDVLNNALNSEDGSVFSKTAKDMETMSLSKKLKLSEQIQKVIETKRKYIAKARTKASDSFINSFFNKRSPKEVLFRSRYTPNIDVELTKKQIEEIIERKDVKSVYYLNNNITPVMEDSEEPLRYTDEEYEQSNIDKYQASGIDVLKNTYNLTGNGVKVGVIEGDVIDETKDCFAHAINNNKLHKLTQLPATGSHPTKVAAVMMGRINGRFEGVAPDIELYNITKLYYYDEDQGVIANPNGVEQTKINLEELVNNGVNIINASDKLGEDTVGQYGSMAKWIDALINSTGVALVQSAGNYYTESVISGGNAYNSIIVGNDYTNDKLNTSHNTTGTYKPDITASGDGGVILNNSDEHYTPCSGTSCAAPLVTGVAALLCQSYPYLKTNPVFLKSLLLNGSNYMWNENTAGSTAYFNAYSRTTGSGVVNGYKSKLCYASTGYVVGSAYPQSVSNSSLHVSHALKQVHVTVCGLKPNTFNSPSSIPTSTIISGQVPNFKVEVTYSNNSSYKYTSKCTFDNKCSVVFTPPYPGTYYVTVTRTDIVNNNAVPVAITYASV